MNIATLVVLGLCAAIVLLGYLVMVNANEIGKLKHELDALRYTLTTLERKLVHGQRKV
jgi:hypothetical protein